MNQRQPSWKTDIGDEDIDFGFRTVRRAEKAGLVRDVFDSVASRYDLMNDLMSGGVHRLWKAAMVDWMAPQPYQHLVDLAGGTGDISLRFLKAGGGSAAVTDINESMLAAGRKRRDLGKLADRINWCVGNAEALPFQTASADLVTIAFGLRNVTHREAAIAEAHRILRPGGRFLCLEFSQVSSDVLARAYDAWSFNVLPRLGQLVAGDADSYRYLVESIRTFPTPEVLADMFAGAGFAQVRVRRMSAGIACIHSGWKLD
ncbi:MAG: class I SAM-dependent methyltransferase [Candidatus Puniceispirillaceae bacterium]|jgi:demethylmenaquinone methyltransferase/2-methoxy-6-polyprenyl-1,4-benzoquinol methylase